LDTFFDGVYGFPRLSREIYALPDHGREKKRQTNPDPRLTIAARAKDAE
jgi:hypothetical protein